MMTKEEYHDMYLIVGAAMDVYNEIGRGLSEYIYQEAMRMELEDKGILAEKEKVLNLYYKGRKMEKFYVAVSIITALSSRQNRPAVFAQSIGLSCSTICESVILVVDCLSILVKRAYGPSDISISQTRMISSC